MGVFVLERGLDNPMKDEVMEWGRCSRALCEGGGTMLKSGDVRLIISIVVALVLAAQKFPQVGNLMHDDILMSVSLGLELGMRVEVHVILLRNFDVAACVWRRPDVSAVGGMNTVEDVKGKFYGSRKLNPPEAVATPFP
jgi:hypothetical protein